MSSVPRKPLEDALCQPHIMENCNTMISSMLALAKTCHTFYRVSDTLKIKKLATGIAPDRVIGNPYNSFIIDNQTVSGHFLHLRFESLAELEEIINEVPSESFEELHCLNYEIKCNYNNYNAHHVIGLKANLNALIQKILNKSFNVTKICIRAHFVLFRTPFATNYLQFIKALESKRVTEIKIVSTLPIVLMNIYSNARLDEPIILMKFPRLEDFIVTLMEDTGLPFEVNLFEILVQTIQRSGSVLYKLLLLSLQNPNFFALSRTYAQAFEAMGQGKRFKTIVYPNIERLTVYESPVYEACLMATYVAVNFRDFSNYLKILTENSFLRFVRRLNISCSDDSFEALNTTNDTYSKLNFLTSLKHFSITFISDTQFHDLNLVKCVHSLPAKTLIILEIHIQHTDALINPLPDLYPNLRELRLTYSVPLIVKACPVELDYFYQFKNLTILHIECIKKKAFKYPASLRVLIIECELFRERITDIDRAKRLLATNMPYQLSLEGEKLFKTYENVMDQDDLLCNCRKSQGHLRNLVIKRAIQSAVFQNIHFSGVKGWDLYCKTLQREKLCYQI